MSVYTKGTVGVILSLLLTTEYVNVFDTPPTYSVIPDVPELTFLLQVISRVVPSTDVAALVKVNPVNILLITEE